MYCQTNDATMHALESQLRGLDYKKLNNLFIELKELKNHSSVVHHFFQFGCLADCNHHETRIFTLII